MINTESNFLTHLNANKHILGSENRQGVHNVKDSFLSSVGNGVEYEAAFKDAIKNFQEKMNPAEDMLITSEKIAEKATNTLKPNPANFSDWSAAIEATVPMLQIYNTWVNHLDANKNKNHVFYA